MDIFIHPNIHPLSWNMLDLEADALPPRVRASLCLCPCLLCKVTGLEGPTLRQSIGVYLHPCSYRWLGAE